MKWLALLTIMVFLGGGLLHALVPHDHGDSHAPQGIEWASLHSALAHDDKKIALPVLALFTIIVTAVAALSVVVRLAPVVDPLCEEIRRGRAKYRTFG